MARIGVSVFSYTPTVRRNSVFIQVHVFLVWDIRLHITDIEHITKKSSVLQASFRFSRKHRTFSNIRQGYNHQRINTEPFGTNTGAYEINDLRGTWNFIFTKCVECLNGRDLF